MAQENVPIKVGILELLRGVNGAQFVIPAYQRNYTWTAKKEVNQLFEVSFYNMLIYLIIRNQWFQFVFIDFGVRVDKIAIL